MTNRLSLLAATILLSCLTLSGCGGDASSRGSGQVGKPKIALVMKSLANEFFSTMQQGAETHAQANAQQYELLAVGIKDERDLGRQVALVDEMVAAGARAIVIAPADSKALVPALRKAQEAGVVVINIDNRLDRDVLEQEGVQIPFVGPDNLQGAYKVAMQLGEKLSAGDEVAILEGIRTSFNAAQRLAGFEKACQEMKLKIVSSQSAEWEMAGANTIASSVLSEYPGVKAILCANDSMALGALAAVKSAGKSGDVQIVGFDNIAAVRQAIQNGDILATVDQHGAELAVFGIEAALKFIDSDSATVANQETPVDVVTANSL